MNYVVNFVRTVLGYFVMFFEDNGVTELSLNDLKRQRHRIGEVTEVILIYPPASESWGFYTVVTNDRNEAWIFSGFAWGYPGEGPRGLETMLKVIGFVPPTWDELPPAHVAGVWTINRSGVIGHRYDEPSGVPRLKDLEDENNPSYAPE